MKEIENKVVMITGSTGNLGVAVAGEFLNAGANLVLTDRKPDRLQSIYTTLSQEEHLLAASIDNLNPGDISKVISEALAKFGRIDVLVNTVGGYDAGNPVHQTSYEQFNHMIDLNLKTAVLASQAVAPIMLNAKSGKIINIGSRAGLKGAAGAAAYSLSKSAVIRLTESMSAELRADGINVNCVLPGTMDTPQNRKAMPNADYTKWVTPESIARVILFLTTDGAKDIHGAAIPVYGLT